MDRLDRAITGLARWSVRVVPAERREWAEAVWAEAGQMPPHQRLFWVAGGLWTVTRQAGIVRRIGYWLGIAALAVGAAEMVSLVWQGAPVAPGFRSVSVPQMNLGTGIYVDPHTTGDFRSLAITTAVVLAALPWVARRRGAFGPASDSPAARAVRVGGCAAICVLVLVLARLAQTLGENLAGGALAAAPTAEIIASLTVILVLAAWLWLPRLWLRGPGNMTEAEVQAGLTFGFGAAALVLLFVACFFGGGVLIIAYAAGVLAVTARGSRIAPATLVFGAGAGVACGLIWYAAGGAGVAAVLAASTAAGAAAASRTPRRDDPEALRRDRLRQGLVAGALTGGVAALLITILIFGTMVVLHRQTGAYSITGDSLVLLWAPLLGMALGLGGGSVVAELRSGLRRDGAQPAPGGDTKERAPAPEPILTWWGGNRRAAGAPKQTG